MRRFVFGCLAILQAGCGVSFPDEFLIEDLRVLNIRAEPPEVPLFGPATTVTASGALSNIEIANVSVLYEALVAHPDSDATFEFRWFGCRPRMASLPCSAADEVVVDARVVGGPTLEYAPGAGLIEEFLETADLSDPASAAQQFGADPRDLLNGLYAHMNVRVGVGRAQSEVDTDPLFATKRVVVYDPTFIRYVIVQTAAVEAGQLAQLPEGVPRLCVGRTDGELTRLFDFLDERIPNQSPVIDRVEASVLRSEVRTATVSTSTDAIVLLPGQALELEGFAGEGADEAYRVINGDCGLEAFTERPAFSWFTSAGSLSNNVTNEGTPRTVYTAPDEAVDVRIWSVLRDGRGGSSHRALRVEVRE